MESLVHDLDRLPLGLDDPLGGKYLGHLESALHVDGGQVVRRADRWLQPGIRAKQQRAAGHVGEHFAERADAFHRAPDVLLLGNGLGQREAFARRAQAWLEQVLADL